MSTVETGTWPEGVIARYVTVGGGTVDLRHDVTYFNETEPNQTVATCGGCPERRVFAWGTYAYRFNNGSDGADNEAREWAQSHAESCRAMPKQGGAS